MSNIFSWARLVVGGGGGEGARDRVLFNRKPGVMSASQVSPLESFNTSLIL
jgi:hypothetical protein